MPDPHAAVRDETILRMIKLGHTALWLFFAGCVLAIPVAAWLNHFKVVLVLIAFVAVEIATLALNGWRCPLQAIARRYASGRDDPSDIYLPVWLARRTMVVFGPLFMVALVAAGVFWRGLHG